MDSIPYISAPLHASFGFDFLGQAQIEQFGRDGFLSLPEISPPEDVRAIRCTIIRMHEGRVGFREGAQLNLIGRDDDAAAPSISQILSPHLYAKSLRRSAFFRNAFAIARQLLGPEAQFSFDHALIKPPGNGAPTPWHQDEAFRDPAFDYHEISVWMPLQPADLQNGLWNSFPVRSTAKFCRMPRRAGMSRCMRWNAWPRSILPR